jgi:hypothetical protein
VVHEKLLLACPRVAPDWEFAALRALMKPQARGPIVHRLAAQIWSSRAREAIERSVAEVAEHLGLYVAPHFPRDGDYHFACEVDAGEAEETKALAVLISSRLPELWFVLGRTYLKRGQFHRRAYGFKLKLVPASNVHLTRPLRAAVRELL